MKAMMSKYSDSGSVPAVPGGIVKRVNDASSRIVLRPQRPMKSAPSSEGAVPCPARVSKWQLEQWV